VHLYQIWLLPAERGIEPSYEQRAFPVEQQQGRLRLVASPDAADGSLTIHQDAKIYLATLAARQPVAHPLAPGRHAWLQVLRGNATLNGQPLATSDGAAISEERQLTIVSDGSAEVMLFDLA
jgi:redox-sensitive bicupin YhaK (pirin superfamily)